MEYSYNMWKGQHYSLSANRVLVLGESWYTPEEPLSSYVPAWASGRITDVLFSRLFNDCSGLRRESATTAQRLAWWDTIAFYNFVPGSIGPTTRSRPSRAQYESGATRLSGLLIELAPYAVWIIGKQQSKYSFPVVRDKGIASIVVNQPRSGVSSEKLRLSWAEVRAAAADRARVVNR